MKRTPLHHHPPSVQSSVLCNLRDRRNKMSDDCIALVHNNSPCRTIGTNLLENKFFCWNSSIRYHFHSRQRRERERKKEEGAPLFFQNGISTRLLLTAKSFGQVLRCEKWCSWSVDWFICESTEREGEEKGKRIES